MTDDEVEALAAAAAGADQRAMERLLRRIEPAVMSICARLLPCRQDAEEACQDALVLVAKRIDTFQGRSKFTTWLHVVASNSARTTYRSMCRRGAQQTGQVLAEPADPRTTSVIAGTRLDLLDALEKLEADRADLVAPLVLRDLYGLAYTEIAEELAVPLGTVKSRIHEARNTMRLLMGRR